MSQQSQYDLVKKLKPARIIIPIIAGLVVVGSFIVPGWIERKFIPSIGKKN